MILVIDNYDSFVYNLARYIRLAGWRYKICRNDALSLNDITRIDPEAIILSPGPCSPTEAGLSTKIIQKFGIHIPILGVCLGHQCIAAAYGDKVIRAKQPIHGKASKITHNMNGLFKDLPNPLTVGRYHSLVVERAPDSPLIITATGPDKQIMAIKHEHHPVYGVQFHPESILTQNGMRLVENFKFIAQNWRNRPYKHKQTG